MMYIAICDDNQPMLDFLQSKIGDFLAEMGIEHEICCFQSGISFLESHLKYLFDVVFLDIIMPELNGFEIAKQVRRVSKNTYIIFITTNSSLVYDSFDFQPFYFIPKCKLKITEEKLKYVIGKLSIHMASTEKVLISGSYENKKYVSPDEILFIKSNVNNVEYHMIDGTTQVIRSKLDDVSKSLNSYVFTRTHNRFIVNMSHIDTIDYPNMEIHLDNGNYIRISRGYKKDFEKAYIRYTRNFS